MAGKPVHGLSGTRTYKVWESMRKRCMNPNSNSYHRYGGRGIKTCERWNSFQNFLADMGIAPLGLSLDRINNDGNYEPDNCRWATAKEQVANSTVVNRITFLGETRSIGDWERHLRLSQGAIWHRLKSGWPIEKALTMVRL